ncbi:MAG: S41 family peptidase [Janthinobacterium lividum]
MSRPRRPACPVRSGFASPSRDSRGRRRLAGWACALLLAGAPGPVAVRAQPADAGAAEPGEPAGPVVAAPVAALPVVALRREADAGPDGAQRGEAGRDEAGRRETDTVDTTGQPAPPVAPAPPALPADAAAGQQDAAGFDTLLAGQVIGTALAFIAPRSLDPTTVPGLAAWGLQGLATLDPSLRLRVGGGVIRLDLAPAATAPGGGADAAAEPAGFARPFPPDVDASAWGAASAAAMRWAWDRSATLRAAGGEALLQGYFDEIFSHLDPYSRYVPPDRAEHVRDRLAGQVGVGVELARLGANLVLATVAANGPAAQAGLRAGDRLLAVDGVPTRGAPVAAVAASLVGEEDSEVRLRVAGPHEAARTLALRRAVVPPETVFAERRPGASGVLLSLRITAFTADTAQRLSQELEAGLDSRVTGLVIDLRGDRGGLLRQAVTAVALLLDQGVVATTVGRDPEASRVWRVQGGDLANRLPIVVLVDGRTASAAEIMAAGLADQRRAVVVGSATTGKGVVQTLTELPDGGEIFVTWSRVLAPRGWPLQGLGVLPQLCTSLGAETTARQLRSLAAGTQELAPALQAWRAARAPLDAHAVAEMRGACPAAEGRDRDFDTARALLGHPGAYAAALLPAQEERSGSARTRKGSEDPLIP